MVPTDSFSLPRDRDKVRLEAQMGSSNWRLIGIVGTVGGVGATLLGGAALAATPILENQDVGSRTFRTGVLAGGIVLLGVGVLALGTGLYLWSSNASSVRLDRGALSAQPTKPSSWTFTGNGLTF
jgi:hypothetical protein